jgi:two-component system, chemotaxis family, chemotaxis protein CheV
MSKNKEDSSLKVSSNEMELVDFRIKKQENGKVYEGIYGVNVAKVQEIIRLPKLTELPGVPGFVEGIFDLRGVVIPVINLAKWMGVTVPKSRRIKPRIIITEFNNVLIGFIVHEAKRIRRISWKDIEPANFHAGAPAGGKIDRSRITGVTRIEGDQVLLILDLESIVEELGFYQPDVSTDLHIERFDGMALVLDDSSIARKMIRNSMEKMGFRVIEATDGMDGLDKIEKMYETYGEKLPKNLKIIVSDVEMPKMDGFHFAATIKNDKRFGSIPIIFNSSISDQHSNQRGIEAGGEAYLVKFDANTFYKELKRVIDAHKDD